MLIVLHEGEYSAGEIAEILGEDVKNVANHLKGLYEAGCIEFVGHKSDRQHRKPVYRAIKRPLVADKEFREMSTEERHDLNGAAVQWIVTEFLASYRGTKMDLDEDLCLIADELNLDSEGKEELRELFTTVWREKVQEIACKAANRLAESGGVGTPVIFSLLAFERGHPAGEPARSLVGH